MPSRQRLALPALVERLASIDPECGVVLQGSVQHGRERTDSDLDITCVLGDGQAPSTSLLCDENRGGMIRVLLEGQLNLDINWLPLSAMLRVLESEHAREWFIFSHGEILHDPAGHAARCQELGRHFFKRNPILRQAWVTQNEEVRLHKADRTHALRYPRWPDFSKHLIELQSPE